MLDFSLTAFLPKVEETDLALVSRAKNVKYKSITWKLSLYLGNAFYCKFGCILTIFKMLYKTLLNVNIKCQYVDTSVDYFSLNTLFSNKTSSLFGSDNHFAKLTLKLRSR